MEIVDALLQGQRGRRLLWEFMTAGEEESQSDFSPHPLYEAMYYASTGIDDLQYRGFESSDVIVETERTVREGAEKLAELLERTELFEVKHCMLQSALESSVDAAMYWQPPYGQEFVLASPILSVQLERIAKHIAASGQIDYWFDPLDMAAQHRVNFDIAGSLAPATDKKRTGLESLIAWKDHVLRTEMRDARENQSRPIGNFSGEWWSAPNMYLEETCGEFATAQPIGLICVEDGFGWEKATTRLVDIPPSASVLEISSAEQWVKLCQDHPIEVTAQKRHDWYHVTGRDGAWAIPDWLAVARNYDGVHLSIGAYLALAGQCLPVDAKFATLIAGWDPGKTYWFIDGLLESEPSKYWKCVDANSNNAHWVLDERSRG